MYIKSKTINSNCNEIKLFNNNFIIEGKKYPISSKPQIMKDEYNYIDLEFLYKEFKRIKKQQKFKDFLIILSDEIEGIFIEFSINPENMNAQDITVYIGSDFINLTDEIDILSFFCHELGHLLDSENLYKNEQTVSYIKNIIITLTVAFNLYVSYFIYTNQLSYLYYTSILLVFGLMGVFTKIINERLINYYSRQGEYNADVFAVKLMRSPQKVIDSYIFLQTIFNEPEVNTIDSTHPSLPQRIKYLKRRFFIHLFLSKIFKI